METPQTWRIRRTPLIFSVTLITLYFSYVAACVFAPDVMGQPSVLTPALSWSLALGILLLLITVIVSTAYILASDGRSDQPENSA